MCRISGGELFERIIDEDFELTEREVIKYMLQIIDGVNFIHKQGVVHLDLKPENIMCVNKTGSKIKLIDFGLARRLGSSNTGFCHERPSIELKPGWWQPPGNSVTMSLLAVFIFCSFRKCRNFEGSFWDSRICCPRSDQLWSHRLRHWHVEYRSHLLHLVSPSVFMSLGLLMYYWLINECCCMSLVCSLYHLSSPFSSSSASWGQKEAPLKGEVLLPLVLEGGSGPGILEDTERQLWLEQILYKIRWN